MSTVTVAAGDYLTVQVTVAGRQQAERLARTAVERRLAASAQLSEVRSIYRWKGDVHERDEQLVTFYLRAARYEALAACVRELHEYEVPQIVAFPLVAGWPPFLEWIEEMTQECLP